MKKLLAMVLAITMSLSLVSCSSKEETPDDGSYKWPNLVKLSITGSGTTAYAGTLAWANLMEGSLDTSVRLLPEDSNATKFQRVKKDETLMTYDTMGDCAMLIEGRSGYSTETGGPYQIRWVWADFQSDAIMFTRGDTDIQSIQDITKDTPIACCVDSSMDSIKNALSYMVGCEVDEMNWVYCSSYGEMPKLVTAGSAEVCAYLTPQSTSLVEASAAPQGVRVLDFNPDLYPEEVENFHKGLICYTFNEITNGHKEAIGKYGFGSYGGWLTCDTADQDLVYNMVKYFAENTDAIKNSFETYSYYWSPEFVRASLDNAYVPIAEGTIRYFKEVGMWTEADDARQEYNVKLIDKYMAAYAEAIAGAKAEGITIDPMDEAWVQYWDDYRAAKELPVVSVMSDEQISEALAAGF